MIGGTDVVFVFAEGFLCCIYFSYCLTPLA